MAIPAVSGFVLSLERMNKSKLNTTQGGNDTFLLEASIKLARIQPVELPVGYTFIANFVSCNSPSHSPSPSTRSWSISTSCLFQFQQKKVSEMQDGFMKHLLSASKKSPKAPKALKHQFFCPALLL